MVFFTYVWLTFVLYAWSLIKAINEIEKKGNKPINGNKGFGKKQRKKEKKRKMKKRERNKKE